MNEHNRVWPLQEAKARFSEVVRLAQAQGPQTVTVHGRPAVQIVPVSDVARQPKGLDIDKIVAAFRSCPVGNLKIPRVRTFSRFREPPI